MTEPKVLLSEFSKHPRIGAVIYFMDSNREFQASLSRYNLKHYPSGIIRVGKVISIEHKNGFLVGVKLDKISRASMN